MPTLPRPARSEGAGKRARALSDDISWREVAGKSVDPSGWRRARVALAAAAPLACLGRLPRFCIMGLLVLFVLSAIDSGSSGSERQSVYIGKALAGVAISRSQTAFE